MKKSAAAGVVLAVTAAAVGTPALVASAQAAAESTVASQTAALDATTPEGVRALIQSFGVTDAQVDAYAARLGLDREGLYEKAAQEYALDSRMAPRPGEFGGVHFDDGKIRYDNVSQTMRFTRSARRTQVGRRIPGGCEFPNATQGYTGYGTHAVSEVIELDPEACTRVVFDGEYDPAAQPETPKASSRATGTTFLNCYDGSGIETGGPTAVNPGIGKLRGEYRRYYKHSFVDPVCITITSTALNVRWKNSGSTQITNLTKSSVEPFYFTALGEDWPSSDKVLYSSAGAGAWTAPTYTHYADHWRKETDFPEHLAAAAAMFGIAGVYVAWAACGFDWSHTHFYSGQSIKLMRNGATYPLGSDSVSGGCSNLIHSKVWHGTGYVR